MKKTNVHCLLQFHSVGVTTVSHFGIFFYIYLHIDEEKQRQISDHTRWQEYG